MDFYRLLEKRRSIRKFKDTPVEEEKLRRILEAACSGPSAGNLQAFKIYVVTDEKIKSQLRYASFDQEYVEESPVVLVFLANPSKSARRYGQRGRSLYAIQDATIACMIAHLACVAENLGSVWIGAFDDELVKKALGCEEDLKPVAILPIGYPDEHIEKPSRLGVKELVKFL